MWFKRSQFELMTGYLASKGLVRLGNRFEFIQLPIGALFLSLGFSFVEILLKFREMSMMIRTYRNKKRLGLYNINKGQRRNFIRGGRDVVRIAKKGSELLGGAAVGLVIGIKIANEVGKGLGVGELGSKALEALIRKAGLHKEDFERRAAFRSLEESDKAEKEAKK